jgi:hypothetical protein
MTPWSNLRDENPENRVAGNGDDLVKHTIYLAVLAYLLEHEPWSEGLRLRECHAGRGIYEVPSDDPRRFGIDMLGDTPLGRAQHEALTLRGADPSRYYAGSGCGRKHIFA